MGGGECTQALREEGVPAGPAAPTHSLASARRRHVSLCLAPLVVSCVPPWAANYNCRPAALGPPFRPESVLRPRGRLAVTQASQALLTQAAQERFPRPAQGPGPPQKSALESPGVRPRVTSLRT